MDDLSVDGLDLTNEYVLLRESAMTPAYRAPSWRVFRVDTATGASVRGEHVRDGEFTRWGRSDIERLATADEIEAAWGM